MDEAEGRQRRVQVERALAQERERSQFLVESGSALIVGLDPEGRISMFNPAAEAFTGYGKEEVHGKNWFDLFTPRDGYSDAGRSVGWRPAANPWTRGGGRGAGDAGHRS
jgi:PAS domain-containing protein